MTEFRKFCLILVGYLALAYPAIAVQPQERLSDPILEERARILSKNIRDLCIKISKIFTEYDQI